ncbi:tetraspanin-18-like isoform X3 [Physella acuta]|uniref:tetraspanin-18-like isoform X3 n=1 Tax=Physella acuta TaxID=109671 RepID=UPI0027DD7504|nr:tetraspanin-18-like isoform X3 [Physella acuta]
MAYEYVNKFNNYYEPNCKTTYSNPNLHVATIRKAKPVINHVDLTHVAGLTPILPLEVLNELKQTFENTHVEGIDLSEPLKRQRSNRSARSATSSAKRRQHEDGCVTCLRGTLHCYNVFILIVGCAALGVGIWLLVTDFGARKVTPIVGNQLYEVTTYLLIAGGGAVALLAFCGCCGTIREDKCVLSFYGTTLAIVFIVLGAACGLAFFFRSELASKIKTRMQDSLSLSYGVDVRTNHENKRITDAWDAMQRQLQCCGIEGNVTSVSSWMFYKSNTKWFNSKIGGTFMVPESCCAPGNVKICTGEEEFRGPPSYHNNHNPEYRKTNPYLYTTGCYDALLDYLHTYSAVVGTVAAVVPLFLVFGIVISFCLCSRVSGYSHEDEVDL